MIRLLRDCLISLRPVEVEFRTQRGVMDCHRNIAILKTLSRGELKIRPMDDQPYSYEIIRSGDGGRPMTAAAFLAFAAGSKGTDIRVYFAYSRWKVLFNALFALAGILTVIVGAFVLLRRDPELIFYPLEAFPYLVLMLFLLMPALVLLFGMKKFKAEDMLFLADAISTCLSVERAAYERALPMLRGVLNLEVSLLPDGQRFARPMRARPVPNHYIRHRGRARRWRGHAR